MKNAKKVRWLTQAEKERVLGVIKPGAAAVQTCFEHWIHGWDEGLSFCRKCAEKKLAELELAEPGKDYCLDGGWVVDGDGGEFCETCGVRLEKSLTEYGCESEVDHFTDHGFSLDSEDDCYSLYQVIQSGGWGPHDDLPGSDFVKERRHAYCVSLHGLCRRILRKKTQGEREALLAALQAHCLGRGVPGPREGARWFYRKFQRVFHGKLRSGVKRMTIRPVPKKRIPVAGDVLALESWSGEAYKSPVVRLGVAVVRSVRTLLLKDTGSGATVFELEFEAGARPLYGLDALAVSDGFADFAEMVAWFRERYGLPFTGLAVEWFDVLWLNAAGADGKGAA